MSGALSLNPNTTVPSTSFHSKTYGQNIHLENNSLTASRHTSFDNGITFTSKQIQMNELIYMKVMDIDDTGQWLGSLAIGFTNINPDSIQRKELCKSALPNLCQTTGTSYMKRIFEKLTREVIITFYYNKQGAFYILDGKEQQFAQLTNASSPLWGVIDIYGNVKSIAFTVPPQTTNDSKAFFSKYDQKPDALPIRYFKQLKVEELRPISFYTVHGPELDLFCHEKVALRKKVQRLAQPYLFIDFTMNAGDEFYIRILSIDPNYRIPGVLGFTNAKPSIFIDNFDKLPSGDPMALYDRLEFWILNEDAFDEQLKELDEYRLVFDRTGEIHMFRNNGSMRIVAYADPKETFRPFFYLNGRISALSLIGPSLSATMNTNQQKSDKDEDADLCQMCFDRPANCVLLPCGHIFYCTQCKGEYERTTGKTICPKCRSTYTSFMEIADD